MENSNDRANSIRHTKIVRNTQKHGRKKLTSMIVLFAVILSVAFSAHFLIHCGRTDIGSGNQYTAVSFLGIYFLFHNTGDAFPKCSCIDADMDGAHEIVGLTACKKEYALLLNQKGVKIYDYGKYVSEYRSGSGMTIISSFVADYDGDGNDNIFLLLKQEAEEYGEKLIILDFDGKKVKKTYGASFKKVNPWKVQICDVDGDGKKEVSLGVYTIAKYHQIYAKRPFIYEFHNHKLYPKWLGSRLSRPFDDYIFCDVDGDKTDELISVETTRNRKKELNAYKWTGFGFESIGVSQAYDTISNIRADSGSVTAVCGGQTAAQLKTFVYRNGKIKTGG